MSSQKDGNTNDEWLFLILFIGVGLVAWFIIARYEQLALFLWKSIRTIEFLVTFNLPTIYNMWTTPMRWGDATFSHFNSIFGWTYRLVLAIPMILVAYSISINKKLKFEMDDYIISVWNRFPWLGVITKAQTNNRVFEHFTIKIGKAEIKVPKKINLKKAKVTYETIEFPTGEEPLDYLDKHQDDINEQLVQQLGPMITMEKGQVKWQDKNVQRFVTQIIKFVPELVLRPGEPNARIKAWRSCLETHRYERSFAMGILAEARAFGVVEPANFLWLRNKAAEDLKKKDNSAFILWRALLAAGGRCAYPEGAGIFCHYQYERSLNAWAKEHPEDSSLIYTLKGTPWVYNAAASFYDVRDIEKNLRKN